MFLTSIEDIISALREKLPDYLTKKDIIDTPTKKFVCPFHNDHSPSMCLNPKSNYEVATCFSCGKIADIFEFAAQLDNLPKSGPEWVKDTLPTLAELLDIKISLSPPTREDLLRSKLFTLARDIADFIQTPTYAATDYMASRGWENTFEDCYTVDHQTVINHLLKLGWERSFIEGSKMLTVGEGNYPLMSKSAYTWIIRDIRKRPLAFISRRTEDGPKYIHSAESIIFLKREILIGLDLALTTAKQSGLILVEGTGDRFALLNRGITNVAALCGVALTEHHLHLLKSQGIKDLALCLDWDSAGAEAVEKLISLMNSKKITGINVSVICKPSDDYKDIDEFLNKNKDKSLDSLKRVDLFDWMIDRVNLDDYEEIHKKLITTIATAPSAIKREMLARKLSSKTGLYIASILADVDKIQNKDYEKRKERLVAAANKYMAAVESDPTNIMAAITQHEQDVNRIEAEFGKEATGAGYQLARFDALEESKQDTTIDRSGFVLKRYPNFAHAFSNGLSWATGALLYFPGRANAAKTGITLAIACDILVHDPDTTIIVHLTDDSFAFAMPRVITNIAYVSTEERVLTIGEASNPAKGFKTKRNEELYKHSSELIRQFLTDERLIILDGENGSNLSTLEKAIKYIRRKYTSRKILCISDNTHNYSDFQNLEGKSRIERIMENQKTLATKYGICIAATAEYRKSGQVSEAQTKIRLPRNDDIAESRKADYVGGAIIHVYNDVNDRGQDNAEIFWMKKGNALKLPRLMLVFGKNKLTSFKDKLFMDLDPDTVTLKEISKGQATAEADAAHGGGMALINGNAVVEASDWDGDDND